MNHCPQVATFYHHFQKANSLPFIYLSFRTFFFFPSSLLLVLVLLCCTSKYEYVLVQYCLSNGRDDTTRRRFFLHAGTEFCWCYILYKTRVQPRIRSRVELFVNYNICDNRSLYYTFFSREIQFHDSLNSDLMATQLNFLDENELRLTTLFRFTYCGLDFN